MRSVRDMVTSNLVFRLGNLTPEKHFDGFHFDRLCNGISSIVLDPRNTSRCDATYSESDQRQFRRKSKKSSFYSTDHLRPWEMPRSSGGEAPASRRSLDFSSIPNKSLECIKYTEHSEDS